MVNPMGTTMVQELALSPHSKKVKISIVWSGPLYVKFACSPFALLAFSCYSNFLPQPKNMQKDLVQCECEVCDELSTVHGAPTIA